MRFLGLLTIAAMASAAFAQSDPDPRGGWFTITHGMVRQADGTYRDISGMRIPFTVEPAPNTQWKGYQPSSFNFHSHSDALQKIYENDKPANYFGSALPMPSALDDVQTLGSAVGAPWQQMKVGWRIPSRTIPFYVFGAYDTYLGNQGAGNSAFGNILLDTFGGPFWQVLDTGLFPTVPGDYMITFNIAATGITQSDNQIYFLQQWHNGAWNGPYLQDWAPFFSGNGAPNIGASEDIFWYDSNLDSIYEAEEADKFNEEGQTGNEANFAMALLVDTNTQTTELPPSSMSVTQGTLESGNYLSTWSSNNQYAVVNNVDTDSEDFNPIQVVFSTFAPSNNILSLQVTIETSSDAANQIQELCLFNYALNTWVVVKSSLTTGTDFTITHLQGVQPGQYVRASDQEMKAMIRARDNAGEVDVWRERIDLVKWRVTTP